MSATRRRGRSNGPVVVLLHGWPYDIHSFVDVAPLLASAGYRVLMPHLRGYGTTRFLSSEQVRNGQPSALALDTVSFMDALGIRRATIAGFDWGARTANIVAALWPERCKAMVSVSGYLIGNQEAGRSRCLPRPNCSGGISTTSRPNAAAWATSETGTPSQSSFGSSVRRNGASTTPRSAKRRVARQPGSRRHHDPQLSVAARTRPRRSPVRRVRKAPCGCAGDQRTHDHAGRRCQRRAAPEPAPTPRSSPGSTRTGRSPVVSATTSLRKHRSLCASGS